MDKKIQTKFSKLSQFFINKENSVKNPQDNKDGSAVLFSTNNREEYETKKLEYIQQNYLSRAWKKIDTYLENRQVMYKTARIPAYLDYDLMETYPIIGGALRLLMEESTTPNEEGKILNIRSNSERIKKELEDLFYARLNINTNLPMWAKLMIKYGDNFVYLQLDSEDGVIGSRQLPNYEIERHENKMSSDIRRFLNQKDNETSFTWLSMSADVTFKYWQVAHFRLLEDDRRLPYGLSALEPARRSWKNLILVEDAMRTVRLFRALDRRVIYIDVGNIDPKDVAAYVDVIGNNFKRKKAIDPETGQEDIKYNVLGNDQDFFIPVRDRNDGTRIDSLAGASNLGEISDIEYELDQLFAALGIPKPFLQYSETAGEGKNMAMQDIRFARKINRIQQALIQELNKIALIHLYLRGFEDDLGNFELSLNNPSKQAEMQRDEQMAGKVSLFKDAVSDAGGGIAPLSHTMAWKKIFHLNDEEIKLNLEQQYMEKAAAVEMEVASQKISKTNIFDRINNLYSNESQGIQPPPQDGEDTEGDDMGGGGGGSLGGSLGDLGGMESEMGSEGEDIEDTTGLNDMGEESGDGELGNLGGEDLGDIAQETANETKNESIERDIIKLLKENNDINNDNLIFNLNRITDIIKKTNK